MIDANKDWFRRNLRVVLPVAVVQSLAYLWLNRLPLGLARQLPLTAVDEALPLWTWTVWPYLLLLASDPVLPLLVRDRDVFRRLVAAYALAMPTAFLIFLAWPTAYPRPPLPEGASWHDTVYRWLTAVDTPACCFPSGHVIVPALGCWAVCRDGRRCGPWLALLLAACVPSVLTTKQHYLWDVLGALALTALSLAAGRLLLGGKPQ